MSAVGQQMLLAGAPPPASVTYIGVTPVGLMFTDTTSIPGVAIGTASTNRRIFQLVHWYSDTVAPLSAATIGGAPAIVHVSNGSTSASGVFLGTAIISALVPTGTTATVFLSFVTGASYHNMSLNTYSVTGLISTTPADTISDNPLVVSSYSGAIDVQNGGILLLGAMFFSANTGYTISGATQDYTVQIGTGTPSFRSAGSSLAVSATQANRPVGVTAIGGFAFSGTVAAASFR